MSCHGTGKQAGDIVLRVDFDPRRAGARQAAIESLRASIPRGVRLEALPNSIYSTHLVDGLRVVEEYNIIIRQTFVGWVDVLFRQVMMVD